MLRERASILVRELAVAMHFPEFQCAVIPAILDGIVVVLLAFSDMLCGGERHGKIYIYIYFAIRVLWMFAN